VDTGNWPLDVGHRKLDIGQWTLDMKTDTDMDITMIKCNASATGINLLCVVTSNDFI
jgi:hypothetical protein